MLSINWGLCKCKAKAKVDAAAQRLFFTNWKLIVNYFNILLNMRLMQELKS